MCACAHDLSLRLRDSSTCGAVPKRSEGMSREDGEVRIARRWRQSETKPTPEAPEIYSALRCPAVLFLTIRHYSAKNGLLRRHENFYLDAAKLGKIIFLSGRSFMEYIKITKENIDLEHICCAMSGKQSLAKKEWMKNRFEDGLVFYRSKERGKCFIEYIPAENAWIPIEAGGYIYINCLWIAGAMKGHGYSDDLISECIRDAKETEKKGICILSSEGRKKEFLSDSKYLEHKGFSVADTSEPGITLMYLPFDKNAEPPRFKECARHPKTDENGFVLYYTDQCPFTYYWVPKVQEAAKENNIPLKVIHITDKSSARNTPSPVTTYALFHNGKFITHAIQSDKKFLKLAGETGEIKPFPVV